MRAYYNTIILLGVTFLNFRLRVIYAKSIVISAVDVDYGDISRPKEIVFENHDEIFEKNFPTIKQLNLRPIIGVLSQELSEEMKKVFARKKYTSYVAASYVKFLESAGARVVPVLINQEDSYYVNLTKSLNGFLFPGGSVAVTTQSGYGRAGKRIFDLIQNNENDQGPIPLWGTCLGFEMLLYLVAGENVLTPCNALNMANSLTFQPGYENSKLFGNIPSDVVNSLATQNITSNFHQQCALPEKFYNLNLYDSIKILSTSKDSKGVEYISTVEHKIKPFFGTQWHPEKAAFEWANDVKHQSIPHHSEAIRASQAMAETFVEFARNNTNHFATEEIELKNLIYNYSPKYVAKLYGSSFELCYFFK